MRAVLISTYELGRQPFGLASPAAWLREAGADVHCLDLSRDRLDDAAVRSAGLVAFYLPMHTATRLAAHAIPRVRAENPRAHLCAYGIYAPLNAAWLRDLGVSTVLAGEFEDALTALYRRLASSVPVPEIAGRPDDGVEPDPAGARVPRLTFRVPDRSGLPALDRYASLRDPSGARRVVGYTEASRGCKHLCRHCPVVPVYDGQFRVVPLDVVMADVGQQVAAGARHVTFGDPDFFNGPGHAIAVVDALARTHPGVSYDVTIKVEHLVTHRRLVPRLAATGCAFVTTAVEAIDDRVLGKLAKGHTRADALAAIAACREAGVGIVPTFVAFTPWTTLEGYADLLGFVEQQELVGAVPPVQLSLRLVIPQGSRLLDLDDIRASVGPFDRERLVYPWRHPDPRVDALQVEIDGVVRASHGRGRHETFELLRATTEQHLGRTIRPLATGRVTERREIAYLDEPWYC